MPKLVNIDEARIIRCKKFLPLKKKQHNCITNTCKIVLADPSAPSVGTPTDSHMESNRAQSPVQHHDSYPPSPTTSTGYTSTYSSMQPMSAVTANRSVASIHEPPQIQTPVSPKFHQQVQQQQQQITERPQKPSAPKQPQQQPQQSISPAIQQCELLIFKRSRSTQIF
jgi:hypothetical protein